MADDRKPVTRSQLQRALIANALTKPVNVAVPAAVVVVAIIVGTSWLFPIAAVVYGALAAMTFFDEHEAKAVGDRAYGRQRIDGAAAAGGAIEPRSLAAPIRAQLQAARREQESISKTIEDSDLSWADVRGEVAGLVSALESAARRAQKLYGYLEGQDTAAVQGRIEQLDGIAGQQQTVLALRTQLKELVRLDEMLTAAYGEMEQVNAALRTVHARLVGAAVSTEASNDSELAGDVRELRERVETLTTGLEMPAQ